MRAVPGKVVRRDVEQHGHAGMKLARGGQLVAGELGDQPVPLRARINGADGGHADVAHGRGRHTARAQQVLGERGGGGLAIGARDAAPALGRQTPGKLGLAHNLDARRASRTKELGELRDAGAGYAHVIGTLDKLGAVDELNTRCLERAGFLRRRRGAAAVHRNGVDAIAAMAKGPGDDIEPRGSLAEDQQGKSIWQ